MTTQEKYSNIICDFLKEHPYISVNKIEEMLDIPQSTIKQAANTDRHIPKKFIFELLCLLSSVGLEINGFSLSYDEDTKTLFGRKFLENVDTVETINENGSSFDYLVKEARMMITGYEELI